ncbi:transposase, partial [Desulfobacterales bacterium HSG17]|nr:transposase [Desulfobacterales bacterium HSG17]
KTFEKAFSPEWFDRNITNLIHELIIMEAIIPWEKIVSRLSQFYNDSKGAFGKSLRMMTAILIVMKYYKLSDRNIIKQIKENRYIQYFCNVPDEGLLTFLHSSSICVFRKRIGVKGIEIIEKEVFDVLRRAGIIRGDNALIDSTVLNNNIIHPNDVHLIFSAFKKMKQFAKLHKIPVWWDEDEVKKLWREFGLDKGDNRPAWLAKFNTLFIPALEIFSEKIGSLKMSKKRKSKAKKMLKLLNLLEEQTVEKLIGTIHIKNRIVSLDEPDARPIKKGKTHPKCEFGTKAQMSFNREGFMITVENFIGNPNDKTLFPETVDLFIKRMKEQPESIIGDLGYRSLKNFKIVNEIKNVFLGRSSDVSEEKQDFCCKARSATEGFIAVAKNLRGFGCSLYKGFEGDRIWSLLCQTAYNLKKFIQLLQAEKIKEESLLKLGLA